MLSVTVFRFRKPTLFNSRWLLPGLLLAVTLLSCPTAQAQYFSWGYTVNNPAAGAILRGIATVTDQAGNVYTVGSFSSGSMDFEPGPGVTLLDASNGQRFLTKISNSGQLIWAKQFGLATVNAMTIDGSGSLYITGSFTGTVDFNPDPSITSNMTTTGNAAFLFILKLDPDGQYVNALQIGSGVGGATGRDIVVDGSGNVYTTGTFTRTVDFDPGPGSTTLTTGVTGAQVFQNITDVFICKLNAIWGFEWARKIGNPATNEIGTGIAVDATNHVIVTGTFPGIVDFDPGSGTTNLTSAGGTDVFVCQLNSDGSFGWARQMGGPADDRSTGIAADANNTLYTTGSFQGAAVFNPGSTTLTTAGGTDIFVCQLADNGSFGWAIQMGGPNDDSANAIAIDATNKVYTTGYVTGVADFDPGVGTVSLPGTGGQDIFVSQLNGDGSFGWARRMGAIMTIMPMPLPLMPHKTYLPLVCVGILIQHQEAIQLPLIWTLVLVSS